MNRLHGVEVSEETVVCSSEGKICVSNTESQATKQEDNFMGIWIILLPCTIQCAPEVVLRPLPTPRWHTALVGHWNRVIYWEFDKIKNFLVWKIIKDEKTLIYNCFEFFLGFWVTILVLAELGFWPFLLLLKMTIDEGVLAPRNMLPRAPIQYSVGSWHTSPVGTETL